MIYTSEATIPYLSIHHIGNKSLNELAKYSEESLVVEDVDLMHVLLTYFISPWKNPEFHQFTFHNGDLNLNPIYQYVKSIFTHPDTLHEYSKSIASYLYQKSAHPNIKAGDLMIAYIQDVLVEDELVDAIAIFKSENKDAFLTMNWSKKWARIQKNVGIALNKIDKGCLIFNTDQDGGYKILSMDRSNRGQEALYWRDEFLALSPRVNNFYQTKYVIKATKDFVAHHLKSVEEFDKSEEAAIMNRSKEFFQKVEDYNREEYQKKLFKKEEVKTAFNEFLDDYKTENNVQIADSFPISNQAVKQHNKVFKSVIKLDKNFHIYVHGDRRLIERGQDADGQKFYKIYFENEK